MMVQFYAFRRKILEILSPAGLEIFCTQITDYLVSRRPQLVKALSEQRTYTSEIREELDHAFVEFFREKKVV